MSCLCTVKSDSPTDYGVLPDTECLFCAEKHFSTAYALFCESGYETMNRFRMIGELVCAQWHLYPDHRETSALLRDLRHSIQKRETPDLEQWRKIGMKLDEIVKKH